MPKQSAESELDSLVRKIGASISKASSLPEVYTIRSEFLGKQSKLNAFLSVIPTLSPEKRSAFGAKVNAAKKDIESKITKAISYLENKEALLKDSERDIDVTAPYHVGLPEISHLGDIGAIHPIQHEINRMLEIFKTMGFTPFEGRELDTDYYVFDTLNMPPNHPARQNWDSFRTEDNFIPTPHTSNMQARIMRYIKEAPVRSVIYGRCARNEAIDAVHGHTFYQIEGVYVDKNVSVSNMIGAIKAFVEAFFERNIVWKIQPAYFPFVEPGIEFMVRCVFCDGKGCSSCKYSGWLEVVGAGMIHPHVLREGGFDPAKYSGFAWGLGLDRMVMQKNGIKDIRSLFASDLRFLSNEA